MKNTLTLILQTCQTVKKIISSRGWKYWLFAFKYGEILYQTALEIHMLYISSLLDILGHFILVSVSFSDFSEFIQIAQFRRR